MNDFDEYLVASEPLANLLGVKRRQAERIVSALKKKPGLRRIGPRKTGSWAFDQEGGR